MLLVGQGSFGQALIGGPGTLTATVTVPAGTAATVVAGEPGTGGAAGHGNASISAGAVLWPQTFIAGTAIVLDSASPLYCQPACGLTCQARMTSDTLPW